MAEVKGKSIRIAGKHICTVNVPALIRMILLTALALFMILPLVYIISTSLKPLDELYLFPPKFITTRPTFSNFRDLFSALDGASVPFARYFFNSFMVSVLTVLGTVLVCCMGAYGLVKHRPKGAGFIFSLILAALMFSGQVTLIPSYIVIKTLGLLDTVWALIIPKIGVAFNFFLVKQFLEQMPETYLEAARLDGANEWTIFWKIVMPYIKSATATLVVFSFTASWNDYLGPVIYLQSDALKTLPLAVQTIAGGAGAASLATAGAMAAAAFVTVFPTIIVYTVMQGKVMNTMAHSGIKE